MEKSRQGHAVRGLVAASVATLVALLSHVLGGGEVPGWLGILTPWVLSLPVCIGLARWSLSLGRLSVSIGVSQLFFHTMFVLGTPSGADSFSAPGGVGHASHGVVLFSAQPNAAPLMPDSAQMWLWHAIAAAVTVLAVHRGESAVRRIGRVAVRVATWVAARILPGLLVPVAGFVARRPRTAFSTASLATRFELSPLLRRGPPALTL